MAIIVPKSQEMARSKLRSSNVDYFEGLIKPKKFNEKWYQAYTTEVL